MMGGSQLIEARDFVIKNFKVYLPSMTRRKGRFMRAAITLGANYLGQERCHFLCGSL